jgi:hypothetical protein
MRKYYHRGGKFDHHQLVYCVLTRGKVKADRMMTL